MVKNTRFLVRPSIFLILRPQFKICVARVRPWGKFLIPIFFSFGILQSNFVLLRPEVVTIFDLGPEVLTIFDLGPEVLTILIWGQKC